MSNSFGKLFRLTTFGESHGEALGCVLDGCPAGLEISVSDIEGELLRRRPNADSGSRDEEDKPRILSGLYKGKTLGTPIVIVICNTNQNSGDYDELKDIYRPGHGDYTWEAKYGFRDHRGGGRSSGRETAARVAAGAIAKKFLAIHGITITSNTTLFHDIDEIRKNGDSAGGIVTCKAAGVPAGLGEPVFDKLDARIAAGIMSIGACKGIEFGAGFLAAQMKGSENNDTPNKNGEFLTNNCGGILGGISNGQDIVFKAAFKPTPSISLPQNALDKNGNVKEIVIKGRHDVCLVQRAAVVAEAMTALILADFLLLDRCSKV
jgi:chorismate synthase